MSYLYLIARIINIGPVEPDWAVVDVAGGSTVFVVANVLLLGVGASGTPGNAIVFQSDTGVIEPSLEPKEETHEFII